MIGLIGAAAIVTWWRIAIARPGPVLATIAVLGAMLGPFVVWSVHATGSMTGILTMANDAASNEPVGHGLKQFVFNNTFRMYGVLVPPVLLAGVIAVAIIFIGSRFLWDPAAASRGFGIPNSPPPSTQDDAGLLVLVQRGDQSAMSSLFDRYSRVVYSVALRVLRDPASAEDVLQEVFMQIWRNPDSFTATRGSLGGCLFYL